MAFQVVNNDVEVEIGDEYNPFHTMDKKQLEADAMEALAFTLDIFERMASLDNGRLPNRGLAVARTKCQEAGMWLIIEEAEAAGSSIQDGLRGI